MPGWATSSHRPWPLGTIKARLRAGTVHRPLQGGHTRGLWVGLQGEREDALVTVHEQRHRCRRGGTRPGALAAALVGAFFGLLRSQPLRGIVQPAHAPALHRQDLITRAQATRVPTLQWTVDAAGAKPGPGREAHAADAKGVAVSERRRAWWSASA
ncbi:MAG: hypothetical protein ACKOFK_06865 [Betaproteobacteria bacterium]